MVIEVFLKASMIWAIPFSQSSRYPLATFPSPLFSLEIYFEQTCLAPFSPCSNRCQCSFSFSQFNARLDSFSKMVWFLNLKCIKISIVNLEIYLVLLQFSLSLCSFSYFITTGDFQCLNASFIFLAGPFFVSITVFLAHFSHTYCCSWEKSNLMVYYCMTRSQSSSISQSQVLLHLKQDLSGRSISQYILNDQLITSNQCGIRGNQLVFSIRIIEIEMMRNYAESFLNEECPFYRPNPYNKFAHIRPLNRPKPQVSNFTLPLQSSIDELKMNNPFKNNLSISSLNASKIPHSGYRKEIEEVRSLWRKDEDLEYHTAPRRMEDSFLKSRKESVNLDQRRVSMALQELVNESRESKQFFKDDLDESEIKPKKNVDKGDSIKLVQSTRKSNSNFKKSLARYASNNEEVVSKTHFDVSGQVPEEVILIEYQHYYSTPIKKRRLNF